jgi:hypothetical protein
MWDDNISHSGWGFKKMFEQIPFSKLNIAKADVSDPLRGPRDEPDDDKVSPKLRAMVAAMVKADPTKSEEEHLYHLLHTAPWPQVGRAFEQSLQRRNQDANRRYYEIA